MLFKIGITLAVVSWFVLVVVAAVGFIRGQGPDPSTPLVYWPLAGIFAGFALCFAYMLWAEWNEPS